MCSLTVWYKWLWHRFLQIGLYGERNCYLLPGRYFTVIAEFPAALIHKGRFSKRASCGSLGGIMGINVTCARLGWGKVVSRASLCCSGGASLCWGTQLRMPGDTPASRQTFIVTSPASCPAQLTHSPSSRCVAVHKPTAHLTVWLREESPQKIQFKWTEAVYEN